MVPHLRDETGTTGAGCICGPPETSSATDLHSNHPRFRRKPSPAGAAHDSPARKVGNYPNKSAEARRAGTNLTKHKSRIELNSMLLQERSKLLFKARPAVMRFLVPNVSNDLIAV
jgi:hypothetical protein